MCARDHTTMIQRFHVHPEHPPLRQIARAVEVLNKGGLIVYPTEATYALGCKMDAQDALTRLRLIRQLDKEHRMTLICRDLSELASYAQVDNPSFRLLKKYTPGPYTFILPGSAQLPRRLSDPKRKTIGLRIPDHNVVHALLSELGAPLLSSTLQLPGDELPLSDPDEIEDRLAKQVDILLDAGACGLEPTTVVDLTGDAPRVLRQGLGAFE